MNDKNYVNLLTIFLEQVVELLIHPWYLYLVLNIEPISISTVLVNVLQIVGQLDKVLMLMTIAT